MGAVIPAGILGYEGQVIKEIRQDEATSKITVVCRRDWRHRPVDPKSHRAGPANRWLRRTVRDIPLGGHPCEVEIEYPILYAGIPLIPTANKETHMSHLTRLDPFDDLFRGFFSVHRAFPGNAALIFRKK